MISLAVFSTFGLALILPFFFRQGRVLAGWVIALLPLSLTLYFASLLPLALAGSPKIFYADWASELGLSLSFRADGLSLLFALLISGIGTFVALYAGEYLKENKNIGRFYVWFFIFMGAMLGVALSDNLLLLFIFWELTSFSSFILIGFEHERESARASALQALLVTGAGGLAMLAGFLLLGQAGGGFEISQLTLPANAIQSRPLYASALILILLGAFAKSAQFPFHFWLPNAMEAPTPVSAYLHSATMVKAGVYLLARLHPALGGTDLWLYLVGGAGATTMLVGAYLALTQTDLKKLLAYSTISALGALTMLIGLGTPLALKAAVVLLVAHALYKGALFLVAGIIDHETGTRDVAQLGGLFRKMPIAASAAGLAALSMAGLPPLFGFISKEIIYETGLEFGWQISAAIFFMGVSNVFVAGQVGASPFLGMMRETRKHPHEAPWGMWLGPAMLAALSLALGVAPGLVSGALISPAVSAVSGETVKVKLALWHGINAAFLLSVLTVIVGVGLYAARNRARAALQKIKWSAGPARFYDLALDGMNAFARAQTRFLQNGYLRYYLMTIILTMTLVGGFALTRHNTAHFPNQIHGIQFYEAALAALILLAALAAVISPSRLGAVAALGFAGYGVALIYLLFGAPDLAMTQFAIESLTVILFVLAFYHLPRFAQLTEPSARIRDAIIALFAGGLMTALILAAVDVQISQSISAYFAENSLPLAHGRNIVNVILVDFRGLDTLGEITVLSVASIGVYALLKLGKQKGDE